LLVSATSASVASNLSRVRFRILSFSKTL
jgi:hypothetical protein